MALEPDGSRHAVVRYRLARNGGAWLLRLEDPPWESRAGGSAGARDPVQAEHERWKRAQGKELAERVRLLRWTLAGYVRAERLAAVEGLRLRAFVPDPALLLAELEGLSDEHVRGAVLARLDPGP